MTKWKVSAWEAIYNIPSVDDDVRVYYEHIFDDQESALKELDKQKKELDHRFNAMCKKYGVTDDWKNSENDYPNCRHKCIWIENRTTGEISQRHIEVGMWNTH